MLVAFAGVRLEEGMPLCGAARFQERQFATPGLDHLPI
jgi:hypothetical protein